MYYFIYMHPLVARKITSLPQPHQKACILFPSRILTSRVLQLDIFISLCHIQIER